MANNLQNTMNAVLATAFGMIVERNPSLAAITVAPDLQGQRPVVDGSVVIRVPLTKAAVDFDPAVGLVDQDTAFGKYTVTINKKKQANFNINVVEVGSDQNAQEVITLAAEEIANAIGVAVMTDVFAAAADATYFPYQKVIAIGDGSYEDMVALDGILDDATAYGDRVAVTNTSLYGELLLDERVIQSNTNAGSDAIQTAELTDVAGFTIAKAARLKTATARGFATNGYGLAFVPVLPVDLQTEFNLPKNAEIGVYTDPTTGISMFWQAWYDPQKVKARISALLFYGIGKLRPEALVRLVSTGSDVLPDPEDFPA